MLKQPPLSLYIHVPWCLQKCPYCDFNSHALRGEIPHQEYIHHLLADLDADMLLLEERELSTIFIGGGTPSLLKAEAVHTLLDGVRSRIHVANDAEITIEANPSSIEADCFKRYQHAGVNRISIGVQSFNSQALTRLGRIHGIKEAEYSAQLAHQLNLRSFNLDLMHSLPDQSLEESLGDLRQAMIFKPPHLSWYQLTIEPNTLFSSYPPVLPAEDVLWEIFKQGNQLLKDAGYQQYEISAYSWHDHQCQHNINYWRFGDYIGIGCGAHSKLTFNDGRIIRTVKTKHPHGFMQGKYINQRYEVALLDRPLEFFMNRFRLMEKTPRIDFANYTGVKESFIRAQLDEAMRNGYLKETPKYWQITEQGSLYLNTLLELFVVNN